MKKEPDHIWIVEESFNKQPYKPVWMDFTRNEARSWAKEETRLSSGKYRVRKYVPEPRGSQEDW